MNIKGKEPIDLPNDIEDLKEHTLQIKMLEEKLTAELDLTINDKPETVKLEGRVDRIDLYDNILRIIDYKTGTVSDTELKSDSPLKRGSKNKLFQILLYAWIYSKGKTFSKANDYKAGILPLEHLTGEILYANYEHSDILDSTTLEKFEGELAELLTELLNPDVPMSATKGSTTCQYCAFKSICGDPYTTT